MMITTENRATMQAYRHGRSLEAFLDDMWARRAVEHGDRVDGAPEKTFGSDGWPNLGNTMRRLLARETAAAATPIRRKVEK